MIDYAEPSDDQGLKRVYKTQKNIPEDGLPSLRGDSASQRKPKHEYIQVRAKKTNYLESPAVAVYFTNVSHTVNQLLLESQFLEQKNRNESLESYTSTISHEFRTPVSTALMFL